MLERRLSAAQDLGRRLRAVTTCAAAHGCGVVLLSDPSSVTYLTGYLSIVHSPARRPSVLVLVNRDAAPIVITPLEDAVLLGALPREWRVVPYSGATLPHQIALDVIEQLRPSGIGVEMARMATGLWLAIQQGLPVGARWIDISSDLARIRAQKDDWELQQVARAARRATLGLRAGLTALEDPRETELGVKARMEHACSAAEDEGDHGEIIQVQCNVLCRPALMGLHDLARTSPLARPGVAFLLATVQANGYWAGVERSVVVGNLGAEAEGGIVAARNAQRAGFQCAAPGTTVREITAAIDESLANTPFKGRRRFISVRGVGLEKSEHPHEDNLDWKLKAGEVFCLQCYVAGTNFVVGRSDTVVVSDADATSLTDSALR